VSVRGSAKEAKSIPKSGASANSATFAYACAEFTPWRVWPPEKSLARKWLLQQKGYPLIKKLLYVSNLL
jgi:hypothetical protein